MGSMRDLNYNMKITCVLAILVSTALSGAITAIAFTTAPKILITEIFPNPKGKDENKEWIELFNAENEPVNLDGWQIAQTTAGKKKSEKFQIKNLKINPKSYAVISGKNLKKSLRNKENTLTLLTPSGEAVVKIYYKSSEEEKSFSLAKIIDTTKTKYVWLWTSPSKGEKNKDFYYLEGKITGANNKTFTFLHVRTLPTAKSDPLHINYQNINPLLLKIFSKQKTTLKILTVKENNKLILIKIIHATHGAIAECASQQKFCDSKTHHPRP